MAALTAPATVLDVLDARAEQQSQARAYTLLGEGNAEVDQLTFAELRQRALAVAAQLTARGAFGERAILVYPQGLKFIIAFFGCLYAGVVPVPVSAPNRKRGLDVVTRIAADCGARFLLCADSTLDQLLEAQPVHAELAALTLLDTGAWETPVEGFCPPRVHASALALLQYTSGATRAPRGVCVTHANLVANHRQVADCLGSDARTVYVSWLPMFHDMGLGIALQAVWVGVCCVLLAPRAFFQEPRRWLQAISHYRATTSGGPNSAYALCLQRLSPAERQELDLSSWRVAFNGSEPVHISTLERFAETFADAGFRRNALHPVYGMAEATLLAASEPSGQGPVVRQFSVPALEEDRAELEGGPGSGRVCTLVSSGQPWAGTEIVIVDPATAHECRDGRAGEIWIRGDSIASGYWRSDVENLATFGLSTSDGRQGFMRSGDWGVVGDGKLFVLGRQGDLLTIRGRRHYPHDLETSASTSHPALVAHGCAAILVPYGDSQGLVIIQEVARSALRTFSKPAAVSAIRRAVLEHHQLLVHAVVLLMPATLPRTTSGKVRRARCREAFLEQALAAVETWSEPGLATCTAASP